MNVDIVTGYLGAGKTSYINRLLSGTDRSSDEAKKQRLAILVNDFGEINVDKQLIRARQGQMIDIAGGCICCTYGSDLVDGLQTILARQSEFDRLVIECSGVAMPAAIRGTVRLCMPGASIRTLALIHLVRIREQLLDAYIGDTVRAQLQQSDEWIGTHADLLGDDRGRSILFELGCQQHRLDRIQHQLVQRLEQQDPKQSQPHTNEIDRFERHLSLTSYQGMSLLRSGGSPRWRSFVISPSDFACLDVFKSRVDRWQRDHKDPQRGCCPPSRLERIKGYTKGNDDVCYQVDWSNGRLDITKCEVFKPSEDLGLVVIELII